MKRLRVLDLFSGIGGFSLGLERTGHFETVAFCEIDPYCRAVLAKHWPDVPCHDDVETRDFKEGEADVITAGFPCQDISYAGAGAGLAGARSGLYRHVIRAICMVRPRFAILENVAALLGRGLGTVLGDLAAVGYDAEWHCIPASAVGAPHRRDRIWIVAHAGGEQHEGGRDALSGALAKDLFGPVANAKAVFGSPVIGDEPNRNIASSCEVADASCQGLERARHVEVAPRNKAAGQSVFGSQDFGRQWLFEPDVGRVAHGVPSRVDRLRGLGNAVVPQIPEILGRAIIASISREAA